jgi:hypothetical protein
VSRWIRQLLVVTGARSPLTKPVVTAVELQATTEPHCSRGVQPGGICAHVPRGRACAKAASASYASCRSESIFNKKEPPNASFGLAILGGTLSTTIPFGDMEGLPSPMSQDDLLRRYVNIRPLARYSTH